MNYIYGTPADDNLIGLDTPGTDVIAGGEGFDVLWGGLGKDIFVIHDNPLPSEPEDPRQPIKTFIADFQDGVDVVDLSQVEAITSWDQIQVVYEYETDIMQSERYGDGDPQWYLPLAPFRVYYGSIDGLDARVTIDYTDVILSTTPQITYTTGDDDVAFDRSGVYSVHYGNGGRDAVNLLAADRSAGYSVNLETGRLHDGQVHHLFEFRDVIGSRADDTITGDGQNNKLQGAAGHDTIDGGAGHDIVGGGAGDDVLSGGAGRDVLIGSMGVDVMTGGADRDRFLFIEGDEADTITDFAAGDIADVRRWGVESFDDLAFTDQDGATLVSFGDNAFLSLSDHVFIAEDFLAM